MKKSLIAISLMLFTFSLLMIGCSGKYSDAIALNEEYIAMVEDYITELEKANTADTAAIAINNFADKLEKFWPKMQKLNEKYPELKDQSALPEEMKETQKRAEEVGVKMSRAMIKIMPFIRDTEVQEAQERLGAIMMKQKG